jgi:hypothetical protein
MNLAAAFGGKLWILQGSRVTSSPFSFLANTAPIFNAWSAPNPPDERPYLLTIS